MAQSKTEASPEETFTYELREVLETWRDEIDPDPVSQFAQGSTAATQTIVDKLDEMLRYCGVTQP